MCHTAATHAMTHIRTALTAFRTGRTIRQLRGSVPKAPANFTNEPANVMRRTGPPSRRRALAYLAATHLSHGQRVAWQIPDQPRLPPDVEALCTFGNLPLIERVADRLTEAMLAIDESMMMCEVESDAGRDSSWVKPRLRSLYDGVNALLKSITD